MTHGEKREQNQCLKKVYLQPIGARQTIFLYFLNLSLCFCSSYMSKSLFFLSLNMYTLNDMTITGDRFSRGPEVHEEGGAWPVQRQQWHRNQVFRETKLLYSLSASRPSLHQIPWANILSSPPVWAAVLANTAYVQVKKSKSI